MNVTQLVRSAFAVLFFVFLTNSIQAQKNVFIPYSSIDVWSDCDTSVVEISQDENGFLEAAIPNQDWVCLGVDFNETDLTQFEAFEIKLTAEYPDSMKQGIFMFKFKDVNGYRNVDPEERIYNIRTDTSLTDVIVPFGTDNLQRFFPREGVVDPKRINTVMLYFRFDTYKTEKQFIKVLIETVRFY